MKETCLKMEGRYDGNFNYLYFNV